MEKRLVLFGVISVTFLNYSEQMCVCTNNTRPSGNHCKDIADEIGSGTVCYGSKRGKTLCAKITCADNEIHTSTCKDKNNEGDWVPNIPHCQQETKSYPATTLSSDGPSSTTSDSTQLEVTVSSSQTTRSTQTTNGQQMNESTTDLSHKATATQGDTPGRLQESNENIAVFVSVPLVITVAVIIVTVVIIIRRRKARSTSTGLLKPESHGAIHNSSYQDPTLNGNMFPMNDLSTSIRDDGYEDIVDDKHTSIDTSDNSYSTISLPNESENTYCHLKHVTGPFKDSTYSHMNKAQIEMGVLYSHIVNGTAQTTQPVPNEDNTYSHIGKGNFNAKMKLKAVDSGDTYSHIGKESAGPIIKQKTVETEDTYSHIGK